MDPAYDIALKPTEGVKIARLCAIQGQIETAMMTTMRGPESSGGSASS
jgi:hypothetical protein